MPELEQIECFGKPRPGSGLAIQASHGQDARHLTRLSFTESDKLIL
jgi:hypothetical protein